VVWANIEDEPYHSNFVQCGFLIFSKYFGLDCNNLYIFAVEQYRA